MNALVTQNQPRVVVLDMSRVPDLEYSALQMLMEGVQRASDRGVTVWLAALNPAVLQVCGTPASTGSLARTACCSNAREAIARYQAMQPPPGGAPPPAKA